MSNDIEQFIQESIKNARIVYESINDYEIELGVISTKTHRKHAVKIKDLTNAELLFIHEHGSHLRNIPKRQVLQYTLQYTIKKLLPKTLDRIYEGCFNQNWTKEDVKLELEKLCMRIQSKARKIIYDGNILEKNSPSTIKHKKSDKPLLDTSQLVKSITCRLVLHST